METPTPTNRSEAFVLRVQFAVQGELERIELVSADRSARRAFQTTDDLIYYLEQQLSSYSDQQTDAAITR